ncbi:MAG TPA: hypothetical protein VGT98_07210 [Candidatus Elarobacter sp.]|nr:hypothetical protein [Candidatus Elarobacter sp.]HEV2740369.1 hypothetical protein [Candidatus Elarobacter sp.]
MRADRALAVAALAFVVGASGCAPHRLHTDVSAGYDSPAPHRLAPAPANPDLAGVMERFYQQIEGAHWPFAYAMLSRRYRASIGQARFVAQYSAFGDLDVSLRQHGDRVVVATIGAKERVAPARARRFEETTTLAWDGDGWTIDRIVRRDVSRAGTR